MAGWENMLNCLKANLASIFQTTSCFFSFSFFPPHNLSGRLTVWKVEQTGSEFSQRRVIKNNRRNVRCSTTAGWTKPPTPTPPHNNTTPKSVLRHLVWVQTYLQPVRDFRQMSDAGLFIYKLSLIEIAKMWSEKCHTEICSKHPLMTLKRNRKHLVEWNKWNKWPAESLTQLEAVAVPSAG